MRLPSILVSCLFLFGGSAAAFVTGVVPGLSADQASGGGNDATADGNTTAEGNTTADPGGNVTTDGNGTAPDGNTTADGNQTADGNVTADGNATAEGNTTAEAPAGNGTAPDGNATQAPEEPRSHEDLWMYDEGSFIGDVDRTWEWNVDADTVDALWVHFEIGPSITSYMIEDLEIVLRDGTGHKIATLDAPGINMGDDPALEYHAEGLLKVAPGLWSLEVEGDNALADYEFEVMVSY